MIFAVYVNLRVQDKLAESFHFLLLHEGRTVAKVNEFFILLKVALIE